MCKSRETMPGKFEGESCLTKLAYSWLLDGMASQRGDTEEGTPDIFNGPFFLEDISDSGVKCCIDCVSECLQANRILLYESNHGFVTIDVE